MARDADEYLPLSPATLHILLALAGAELHGYAIMQEVARQSEGRYRIGPGTLYDNLQRLTADGVVTETEAEPSAGSRRRLYRLTALGRRILRAEVGRLEEVVRHAKLQLKARRT